MAILNGRIERIGDLHDARATDEVDAAGRVLAPGFIDVHTHDDTVVIRQPEMLPKLSQGVTTVIVGNCGISASPVSLKGNPPDPMNLLGTAAAFVYPRFSDYRAAVEAANTKRNIAVLVGDTVLRGILGAHEQLQAACAVIWRSPTVRHLTQWQTKRS